LVNDAKEQRCFRYVPSIEKIIPFHHNI